MKKLVIAEKPSVARDIANVLGCNQKGEGYLYNDNYIISWAIGHLVTLCEPEEYDKQFKSWKMETLPIIPSQIKTKAVRKTVAQFKVLKNLMLSNDVTSIVCATDSGREGELIFRYIYELAGCKKPFERLWISSMTNKAISDGFANLKSGSEYDNLYISAKCRSEADWLVGINASRAFTIKYNTLLSIGRVQTPTLALIVNKQDEINNFVVTQYYEVDANFGKYKGTWINEKEDSKIDNKEKADAIAEKVRGKSAIVDSVEKEEKKIQPPLLYDLTELQRDCNKKFGFSAQKTLNIAQDLYEKRKMITYPRTDSRHLSDDMIPKIGITLNKLNNIPQYNPYTSYVLGLDKLPITKRIVDNSKISDHHALIPTDTNANINALSSDEFKVYDLIARRFIQVFYPPYVYSTTKIITISDNEKFVTKGTTVISKGWQELNVGTEKKKEEPLPNIEKGEELVVKSTKVNQKKTKPPTPYNEAGLLSAMENAGRFVEDENLKEQLKESGLGTPATRAAIIERLLKVGYIKREKKHLVPTDKGIKLIAIVPPELKSPETTGKWEKGLTSISKGKMDREKFMNSIKRYVCYIVDQSKTTDTKVIFPADKKRSSKSKKQVDVLGICPNCGGNIIENSKGYYCSNWLQGCKFTIWKNGLENYSTNVTSDIVKLLLNEKEAKSVPIMYNGSHARADIVLSKTVLGRLDLCNIVKE